MNQEQDRQAPLGDTDGANTYAPAPEQHGSSIGPLIGIVIVIALLVFGAFYLWSQSSEKAQMSDELPFIPADETANEEAWLPPANESDDAAAIEAELEAMNMSEFESSMDADLEATVQEL